MPQADLDIASVNRTKDEARHYYNRISKVYDILAASEKKHIDAGLDMLDAKPSERILEIGYGTGHATVDLARAVGEHGHVYGVDISPNMTQITRRKLQKYHMADRVSLSIDDASSLPYHDKSMDGIFTSFTLELFHTLELPHVLAECRRVLKYGGHICVVSLSKDKPLPVMGRAYEWLHNTFPKVLDCRPIPVKALLTQADFLPLGHTEKTMWGLPVSVTLAEKGE